MAEALIDWVESFLAEHPEVVTEPAYGHAASLVDYLRATAPSDGKPQGRPAARRRNANTLTGPIPTLMP